MNEPDFTIGQVVYVRIKITATDPGNPWGDSLRGIPVDRKGQPQERAGLYAFSPSHAVLGTEVVRGIKQQLTKESR